MVNGTPTTEAPERKAVDLPPGWIPLRQKLLAMAPNQCPMICVDSTKIEFVTVEANQKSPFTGATSVCIGGKLAYVHETPELVLSMIRHVQGIMAPPSEPVMKVDPDA